MTVCAEKTRLLLVPVLIVECGPVAVERVLDPVAEQRLDAL
jgi:hypothetical protein